MNKLKNNLKKVGAAALVALLTVPAAAHACTSLLYKDDQGLPYAGRTMELPMELPYEVTYFPMGSTFASQVKDHPQFDFVSNDHGGLAATPDDERNLGEEGGRQRSKKLLEV